MVAPGDTARLKLLFVAVTCDEAFFGPVKRGIADAAAMMGVDASFTGSIGVDAEEMSRLARDGLANGIDGLAIDLFDAAAFAPIVAEAHAKGVPVVAFNIDDGGGRAGNLSGIAQDFPAAGRARPANRRAHPARQHRGAHHARCRDLRARTASRRPQGRARPTRHTLDRGDHGSRIRGSRAPHLGDPAGAPGGFGYSGDRPGGHRGGGSRGRAARPAVYAAGFDLSPEILRLIVEGHLDCTVDQQPYTQGFYPVVQLVLNIRYGLRPVSMDAGACMIDRSNVARIAALAKTGYR